MSLAKQEPREQQSSPLASAQARHDGSQLVAAPGEQQPQPKAEPGFQADAKAEPGQPADSKTELEPGQAAAEQQLAQQMDAGAAGKLQEAGVPCEPSQPAAGRKTEPAGHAEHSDRDRVASTSPGMSGASKRKAGSAAKPSPAKKGKGSDGRTAQISSYFTKNSA